MRIQEIDNLISALLILPGVGEKTAKRYAFNLIENDKNEIEKLISSLDSMVKIKKCDICNGYSLETVCDLCLDEKRNTSKLVVVAKAQEIFKIEEIIPNQYRFFALGGVIDPLNGINSSDLQLKKLKNLVEKNAIQEITLILPVTNEGEITAAFIKRSMQDIDVKFNKIAQGVPVGSNLEFLDEITLIKSIQSAVDY